NVFGQVHGKKVSIGGANQSGVQLKWKGKVAGVSVRGTARLKGPGKKLAGQLVLTRRDAGPPVTPPQSCDNAFFTGQVMGRVLSPICANCHVAGGSAQTASFRVTAGDPLATQESVALNIDTAHPDESRILQKPFGALPHGGGIQLIAGS